MSSPAANAAGRSPSNRTRHTRCSPHASHHASSIGATAMTRSPAACCTTSADSCSPTGCPTCTRRSSARAGPFGAPLVEHERRTLNTDHAAVGRSLLRLWGLPARVVHIAASHHTDTPLLDPLDPDSAVRIANVMAHRAAVQAGIGDTPTRLDLLTPPPDMPDPDCVEDTAPRKPAASPSPRCRPFAVTRLTPSSRPGDWPPPLHLRSPETNPSNQPEKPSHPSMALRGPQAHPLDACATRPRAAARFRSERDARRSARCEASVRGATRWKDGAGAAHRVLWPCGPSRVGGSSAGGAAGTTFPGDD